MRWYDKTPTATHLKQIFSLLNRIIFDLIRPSFNYDLAKSKNVTSRTFTMKTDLPRGGQYFSTDRDPVLANNVTSRVFTRFFNSHIMENCNVSCFKEPERGFNSIDISLEINVPCKFPEYLTQNVNSRSDERRDRRTKRHRKGQ
ncbi:hypothetical protein DPMN_106820 [Dreissena polymorpha]|uniref:Uncharacterized protein n=1 Tax=Dreissena polymorpha TaxID=45954 RepID=A0A9D4K5X6_DREPO|nr:hypothetical protein DPMN_106820 [Dreissena polymorpha]